MKYDGLLSTVVFNSNLRRYSEADAAALAEILALNPDSCLAREVRTTVKGQRTVGRHKLTVSKPKRS